MECEWQQQSRSIIEIRCNVIPHTAIRSTCTLDPTLSLKARQAKPRPWAPQPSSLPTPPTYASHETKSRMVKLPSLRKLCFPVLPQEPGPNFQPRVLFPTNTEHPTTCLGFFSSKYMWIVISALGGYECGRGTLKCAVIWDPSVIVPLEVES